MSNHIKIFDTTLRDGEQSPGCSMNTIEKVRVAKQLEKLNVDIIEAGFAIASKGDFEAIEAIASAVKNPIICSLCRAIPKDIEAAAGAIKQAHKQRIHTFIATSEIHLEHKLKMTHNQVIENAVSAVKLAKSFVDDVEFSCEDAGRSDWDFMVKVLTEVIAAGATVLNIPDTVGYLTPQEYGDMIRYLKQNTPGIDNCDISVHCHNDLGLATANSLAGVINGATQIECTINGIGERAGNTALEEVVMAIQTRGDVVNAHTKINSTEIMSASKLVSQITGSLVQPNKAIVGANAFAHEAGIHQDGILKHRGTYEIMDAASVGLSKNNLVLGKHSGRHALQDRLKELGFDLDKDELNQAFERFKALADKKKEITDEDLQSIVTDELYVPQEFYSLDYVHVVGGNSVTPSAVVKLKSKDGLLEGSALGSGPIDAIYNTIDQLLGESFELYDFVIKAVTEGQDSLGHVTIHLKDGSHIFSGSGASIDILAASAKAYVTAINRLLTHRNKQENN